MSLRLSWEILFSTLTCGSICINPIDMEHSYVGKIQALLEKQNREGDVETA